MSSLRIWSEQVSIPTYGVGEKEKNPMFFEKRVYQGSTGKVYPHPVIDKIEDEKREREYTIVFLENEYIQVQVMPEVGGRIYRAFDKTNNYDFVYYNRVMKPALVGLTGPWVSGGIEFNWPQHHRPNTFGPVEYRVDDSQPDVKTVWLSERDRMYGTKVTTGISVRANSARIEISSELYNPTDEAQTFLWWANPAVPVHDETQSIFPPDVHAVMDHGKRDVSSFPIATGTYYKMDYSAGVDISRYKNIPVPTSYMAYHSDFDFVGGYDWREGAGILHVADHHVAPGKKQWTWGNGEFGKAWDRNLTDEDGPYIELMTGVFTDNQPDFTWLAPYSGKRFTQYFMPYKAVGEVKCANEDIVVGMDVQQGMATLKVYATTPFAGARIVLRGAQGIVFKRSADVSPNHVFEASVPVEEPESSLVLEVSADGAQPLVYKPVVDKIEELPEPAQPIGAPADLDSNEALLLAGLHLEQYRHATFEPDGYYLEGLRRDEGDLRINNAYGNLLLKRGEFDKALECFLKAQKRATRHSTQLYDGEVFFNLGKAYEHLGDEDKAFDAYYKACWSDAWKTQGYLKLAQIAARRGSCAEALGYAQESLYTGAKNMKARAAKAILCRLLGDAATAADTARETLAFDPMDYTALRELADAGDTAASENYKAAMRGDAHNHMTLAEVYAELGQYEQAAAILAEYARSTERPYAMVLYMRAAYLQKCGSEQALDAFEKASAASTDYCFPNMISEYIALRTAIQCNPRDARAHYYLGCLLYDKRRHDDAARAWEASIALDDRFPTAQRNLSLYYANKKGDFVRARTLLQRAFELDTTDARVFYELCDLYQKVGMPPEDQRTVMENNLHLVCQRDDLSVNYADVLNACGAHEQALELILGRTFHPWEGGEGKVPSAHITARIGIARRLLAEGKAAEAINHLQKATVYYHSFGEGKLTGAQENNIYYTMGLAHRALGQDAKAQACFDAASTGLSEPASAMYYNDQPPHMIYYQGLALRALGNEEDACNRFNKLIAYGKAHAHQPQVMDYFAVSMPDFMVFETDLDDKNKTHCHYMMGLGYAGLGQTDKARQAFARAREITPNHYGVLEHMAQL